MGFKTRDADYQYTTNSLLTNHPTGSVYTSVNRFTTFHTVAARDTEFDNNIALTKLPPSLPKVEEINSKSGRATAAVLGRSVENHEISKSDSGRGSGSGIMESGENADAQFKVWYFMIGDGMRTLEWRPNDSDEQYELCSGEEGGMTMCGDGALVIS